ncbi:MAG: HAMP domain-containing histidine kinase [Aureispira sp.]|nr:HAMP domain-containing histidine kinase [Aureispira sp.]
MKFLIRYWIVLGIVTVLSFVLATTLERNAHYPPNVEEYAQNLEKELRKAELEVEQMFSNRTFLLNAIDGYIADDTIRNYAPKPYTFIIYNDKDSIIYWNNNNILPYQFDIKYSTEPYVKTDEVGNSIYRKYKWPYNVIIDNKNRHYNIECLIPLYKNYSIQNGYLQNYFPLMPAGFSDYVDHVDEPTPYAVHDKDGEPLIYIQAKETYPYRSYFIWGSILYLLSSLLAILMVYLGAEYLARRYQVLLGFSILFGTILIIRFLTVYYDLPRLSHQHGLFGVKFSSANDLWLYSLGDFLIDTGLLFVVSTFLLREVKTAYVKRLSNLQRLAFLGGVYTLIIAGAGLIQFAFRDIILTSYISFEFNDFSQIDGYSVLALMGIGAMLMAYFLLTFKFFKLTRVFQYTTRIRTILYMSIMCGTILLMILFGLKFPQILVVSIFSATHVGMLNLFDRQGYTSFIWLSLWLFSFSAFTSVVFTNANAEKGNMLRKTYAKKITFERDVETEQQFDQVAKDILDDGFVEMSLGNPLFLSPRKAVDQITYKYLDNNFFGRYDYSVHIYTAKGAPFRGENRSFEEFQEQLHDSQPTESEHLQFYSDTEGSFSYIAELPIVAENSKNPFAIVIISLIPKNDAEKSNVYVQLLSTEKEKEEQAFSKFKYGLYKKNKRVAYDGAFISALPHDMELPPIGEFVTFYQEGDAKIEPGYFIGYRDSFNTDNVSFIRLADYDFGQLLSIFAYIFSFGVFLLGMLILVNFVFNKLFSKIVFNFNFADSFRERIQRGIIIVTLLSFVAIAFVSIRQFSMEYQDYHQSRLKRKINSTSKTATWKIQQSSDSLGILPSAKSLADIHKIDVNLFDTDGGLLSSSEPTIYDRHLLSRRMEPLAYHAMRKKELKYYSQNEQINSFEYLAAYVPLKNKEDSTIAYLNLPYDIAGSNVGSQDVAKFLGALLNVYVLFLLLAGAIALLIANTITRPLSVIGEKLKEVKLGQKNEPIEWDNEDEIGDLVQRYNEMIVELEQSTEQLARSQRESAWRDMAKQVAHEIKNPLTPMKLNIQLLQRVMTLQPDKAKKMVDRVSNTLIEQIDSLAHIASEFSNFAKMPQAQNEVLHLNRLVWNVYNLFKEEENMQLSANISDDDCYIFADKTQITRVLNNLLKNAVQAIPEDQIGKIEVDMYMTSKTAIVCVKDNGTGIPEDKKDEIFVPNFTTKSSGTGIGLSMSKTIVEMAKGVIYFESEEGKGTEFYVEIPRYYPNDEEAEYADESAG